MATAAAGTAYARRQDIGSGVTWAQDHMKYVGNLWDEQKLGERVERLMKLSKESFDGGEGIVFRKYDFHLSLACDCIPPCANN